MDQELIAYLDKRFGEANEQMVALRAEVRGNGVEIEGLRGQIKQVAEGVAAGNENLAAFRTEVYEKFDEMRQMFKTSHSDLHRRVSALEARQERRRRT